MRQRIVLHIGGAKTASTTLQTAVLRQSPTVHHFGEGGDGVTTPSEEPLLASLLNDDECLFDFAEVEAMFRRHRDLAGEGTLVFSSADVLLANRPTVVARRFHELLGSNVSVLLVVRNQISALSSLYSGHGAWLKPAPPPHYRRFVDFEDWLRFQWLRPSSSALASFAYWDQIQPFISEFGRERITLVPFERVVSGDEETWETVSELIGLSPERAWRLFSADRQRERISRRQMRYGRLVSLALPFASPPDVRMVAGPIGKHLARGPRFAPEWSDDMLARIQRHYRKGNAAIEREFSLGLSDLGYPMEDPR
jgi:hypothetical protein